VQVNSRNVYGRNAMKRCSKSSNEHVLVLELGGKRVV
jgi:hypothetical protein